MPTYEFMCLNCKKTFEVVRAVSEYDPKAVKCPKCNGKNVERHWSSIFIETSKKS